jgi:c-di-GMP-binding flagellar brake protein YcgR
MNDLSCFPIQIPKQIIHHLSLLVKNKCLIGARFGVHNEFYITTLLGINEKNNTVVLDYGSKEDLNQHILKAGKVIFDTAYKGIKVSFTGSSLKKITHEGGPAFSMAIPKSLLWLERREYYRVISPLSKHSYCQFILEDGEPVDLKLYDISLTGCSLLNGSDEISERIIPGTTIRQCKLILSDEDEDMISFEVCIKYIVNYDELKSIQKIGCNFINLTPHIEEAIQRYMQKIQREDLQRE